MAVEVRWFGPQVRATVTKGERNRVKAAAIDMRDFIKKQISEVHPEIVARRNGTIKKRGKYRNERGQYAKRPRRVGGTKTKSKSKRRKKNALLGLANAFKKYPYLRTSNLRRNIAAEHLRTRIASRVGTNVPYGKWLQIKNQRPWLSSAFHDRRVVTKRILSRGRIG